MLIKKTTPVSEKCITINGSKSESNRALILSALSSGKTRILNLSTSNDTMLMKQALASDQKVIDVDDAGTTMRFLIPYFVFTNQHKILRGTPRMHERPVQPLVEALTNLGAKINYLEKPGYPPLEIQSFTPTNQNRITIEGNISSQFTSALLMVAPKLNGGLEITIEGKIISKPYIDLTLKMMQMFGVSSRWSGNRIIIPEQEISVEQITIGGDWSSASYWFELVALTKNMQLTLKGLDPNSPQGDRKLVEIMIPLGVHPAWSGQDLVLKHIDHSTEVYFDFSDTPDLAQTVAVVCAAKGIHCKMTGLETLSIKETDRTTALKQELAKFSVQFNRVNPDCWLIDPSQMLIPQQINFRTYDDHRMAMAFAPLAVFMDVGIDKPDVVKKSYPGFWDEMEKLGFTFQF